MKDDKGSYYYPDPADTCSRVYVREGADGIEFRLWRADNETVWEKHDWLPYGVLEAAAVMYKEREDSGNPLELYNLNVAKALIKAEVVSASRRR